MYTAVPWKLYDMVPEVKLLAVPEIFLALLPEEQDDVTVSQLPVQVILVLDTSTTIWVEPAGAVGADVGPVAIDVIWVGCVVVPGCVVVGMMMCVLVVLWVVVVALVVGGGGLPPARHLPMLEESR